MRHWLLCIISLVGLSVWAQTASTDTVDLGGVEVTAHRYERFGAGTHVTKYPLDDRPDLAAYSLADQMRAQAAITIKGYGPSGLNTLSVRGAGASQTAVVWQGFNLQSTMNGQHDLALLPVFFLDEVALQHGPASALYGSGTAGGALHVGSTPSFDDRFGTRALVSMGSFGHQAGGLQLNHSDKHWASDTRLYGQMQQNDFSYINTSRAGMPEDTLTNSALHQWGLQHQDRFLLGKQQRLDIGVLHLKTDREIPPAMWQLESTASQSDQNTRAYADWVYCGKQWSAQLKGGWLYEQINYKGYSTAPVALNEASNWVVAPSVQFYPSAQHLIEVGGQWLYSEAVADGYPEGKNLSEPALFAAYRWHLKSVPLKLNVSARQAWRDNQPLPVVPSVGFMYRISASFTVRGQVARAYRMPTLNDLYWEPGGNPDLRAEHGWSEEAGLVWSAKVKKGWSGGADVTVFHEQLKDQIVWVPGGFIWSPQNVGLVRSMGLEGQTHVKYSLGDWQGKLTFAVQYAAARDISSGEPEPLVYSPDWRGTSTFMISWRNIALNYTQQWTAERLANASGSKMLDPFYIADLSIHGEIYLAEHSFDPFVSIRNITNTSYQTVVSRPMPGIHGVVGFQYYFTKSKSK